MKPLFTIHAGEYLVGSFLEDRKLNVWIPSRDTGIDLLVTNRCNTKAVSLQVKFSKDFLTTLKDEFRDNIVACGWWTLDKGKIKSSKADYWVFVLYSFKKKGAHYLIIEPKTLLKRFKKLGRTGKPLQVYFWLTKKGTAWETRGLKMVDLKKIAIGVYRNTARDFSEHLDNWQPVFRRLK